MPSLAGGSIDQPEPPDPDIGYSFNGQRVGVELTELVGRQASRRGEGEQDATLSRAQSQYEAGGHPVVAVSVVWANFALQKNARAAIATDLNALVVANLPKPGDWTVLGQGEDAQRHISHPAFERIWIAHVPSPQRWESLHQWDGAQADSGFIQRHVSRKGSRPQNYQTPFDETWLLLFVRGSTPSSGFDISLEARAARYDSPFHRIFIFDVLRRDPHELKAG